MMVLSSFLVLHTHTISVETDIAQKVVPTLLYALTRERGKSVGVNYIDENKKIK